MTVRGGCGLVCALLALGGGGCRDGEGWAAGPFASARPQEPLVWTPLDLAQVDAFDACQERALGCVHYRVRFSGGEGTGARQLELRFRRPLDGAKVDARATGPGQSLTLLTGKRIGDGRVAIPLASLPLTQMDVMVHHHLRPAPLLEAVRVGRASAAMAAGAP